MNLRQANSVRQQEWDPENGITLAYRGNELAGEVGEACNLIKKLEREALGLRGTRATDAELAEELADVVICTDLIAMMRNIDLDQAVIDKFNSTSRKYQLKTRMDRNDDNLRKLDEAYLRLRRMIPGAFDTPHGQSLEQMWEITEKALFVALGDKVQAI